MPEKFKQLIHNSTRILVITHISPDPDAVSSLLLMGATLSLNYPDKKILMSSEDLPASLSFLAGYQQVKQQSLQASLDELEPDLVILVDGMNFGRATRGHIESIQQKVKKLGCKLAIIDHHEQVDIEENDFYYNQSSPAAVLDVYELLFEQLLLKKPGKYQETALLGIYADTGGFVYENKRVRDTFRVVGDLLEAGASLEKVQLHLEHYNEDSVKALGELAKNVTHGDTYTYTYFSDDYIDAWLKTKDVRDLQMGASVFNYDFIRNIDNRTWGFIVYRDPLGQKDDYKLSFRALSGTKDVSLIANKLGGGGHKAAAGASFKATNLDDAIKKIKAAIQQMK